MANTTIYYPLIKKGFQEAFDTSSIESDIAQLQSDVTALQSNKVTKFFSATDTLEDGEVAEYQGPDDAVNGLENGYFYKKNNQPSQTVNVCRLYVDVPGINFLLTAGDYIEDGTESETIELNTIETSLSSTNFYTYINAIDVGTIICKSDQTQNPYSYTTVINVTEDPPDYIKRYFCDDGTDFTIVAGKGTRIGNTLYKFTKDGATIKMLQNQYWSPVAAIAYYNNKPYPIIFMPWQVGNVHVGPEIGHYTQKTIIPAPFIRVNTQPPTPGVTENNGILQVSLPVQIENDLTVKGTQTVVHTEEIESENDYIELRADNPLGLASGEMSGIEVNNYDGNGTDCVLAVDATGWARVGDKNGTLQKLATIEETPTADAFMKYNATDKELESTTDGSTLNINFTDNEIPYNIKSGEPLSTLMEKICNLITPFYKFSNQIISNNSDLNDYTQPGCYYIDGGYAGGGGNNILNKPIENRGMIIIIFRYSYITDSNNWCSQLALVADGRIYYRTNTSSWNSWAKIL